MKKHGRQQCLLLKQSVEFAAMTMGKKHRWSFETKAVSEIRKGVGFSEFSSSFVGYIAADDYLCPLSDLLSD